MVGATDAHESRVAKKSLEIVEDCTLCLHTNRFLQGWDHTHSKLKWNFPSRPRSEEKEDGDLPRSIPHYTVLPGLQFSLAGVLGKPETFYQVPALRFAYHLLYYL